jgi:hypothetical protein
MKRHQHWVSPVLESRLRSGNRETQVVRQDQQSESRISVLRFLALSHASVSRAEARNTAAVARHCSQAVAKFGLVGLVLLVVHAALLAFIAWRIAPVSDEAAHLASGLGIWQTGSFERYPVNPPLIRMVASAPVALMRPTTQSDYHQRYQPTRGPDARPEWGWGIVFVRANRDCAQWYFAVARWACLPFGLVGGITILSVRS